MAYKHLLLARMRTISTPMLAALFLLSVSCSAPSVRETSREVFHKPISFSILEDYDKGADLAQVEADFRLFKELGVTTWRGSFGWDDYEPERGVYDFAWLHQFARLAARHHITLRPYIGYTPSWAATEGRTDAAPWNNPPARVEDWYRFVLELVSDMGQHDNVLSFEIYNEQNSPLWWDGSVEEYAQVLTHGSEAIRSAEGDGLILMGGITYPDVEWLEKACTALADEQAFDVLPLHAYPETWDDLPVETFLDQHMPGFFHETFILSADQECGTKPIWINETGFATTPGKKTERDQANWWARAIATFVADRRVEHIGIYEIKDRPITADVIGEPENHYLGLTYPDRTKKLAFNTVKRLVALLNTGVIAVADDAAAVSVLAGEKGALYHHFFIRPDGRQVVLLWDRSAAPLLYVTLPRPGTHAIEYALDGTGSRYMNFDGERLLDVQLAPGDVRIFEITP